MMEQVDVCNSWEEFDDNAKLLEQQLEKLKLQKARQKIPESQSGHELLSPESSSANGVTEGAPKIKVLKRNVNVPKGSEGIANGMAATTASTNGITNHSEIVIQDDSMRTQYVPPEPRISILSRPKKKGSEDSSAAGSKNSQAKSQAVKTLEQREQEYAEARRRIFGDDAPVETETESSEAST